MKSLRVGGVVKSQIWRRFVFFVVCSAQVVLSVLLFVLLHPSLGAHINHCRHLKLFS